MTKCETCKRYQEILRAGLTKKQMKVIHEYMQGGTRVEIALRLSITELALSQRVTMILKKFGMTSQGMDYLLSRYGAAFREAMP